MKALAAAALGLYWSGIMVILCEVMLGFHYGHIMVISGGCCGCCISQERGYVMAAMPARRE